MTRRTSKLAISLAALTTVVIAGCSSSGDSSSGSSNSSAPSSSAAGYKLVQPGTLTVAVPGEYPPLVIETNGQLGGVEGDWAVEFAKDHDLKIKLFQTSFAGTILAVEQHRADLAMSLIYTPERAKQVYYTYPSDVEGLQIFTKPNFNYTGPSSLSGQQIGTVTGYGWTATLLKDFGSRLHLYQSPVFGEKALQNGQITAFFEGVPIANQLAGMIPHNLNGGAYGIPEDQIKANDYDIVNCDNPGLANALNQELSKLFSDGRWTSILNENGIKPGTLTTIRPELKSPPEVCS